MKQRFAIWLGVVAWMSVGCGGRATGQGAAGHGGGSPSSPGGSPGKEGVGGDAPGAEASCPDVKACGGSVVGAWSVASSCLEVTGSLDLQAVGLSCPSAGITGSYQVTGTWSADSSGGYVDDTMTTGTEQIQFPSACLDLSGVRIACDALASLLAVFRGYTADCRATADGGCSCAGDVRQAGGAGHVRDTAPLFGRYTTSGNELTLDSNATERYCVAADTMTWTPRGASEVIQGTIVFQR